MPRSKVVVPTQEKAEKLTPARKAAFERGLEDLINDAYEKGEVVGAEPGEKSPFKRR